MKRSCFVEDDVVKFIYPTRQEIFMTKDMFGKTRIKLGLHIHTTRSDGKYEPEVAAQTYKNAGFDAIALTDHWVYGEADELCGLPVLSGAEYNIGFVDCNEGVYHILALMCEREPDVKKEDSAQHIIDEIHKAGGLSVLAHPAWSLNTPEMMLKLRDVDATEIYNAVSDCGNSRRGESSLIVDMLGMQGCFYPLLATDDCHYYSEGDCCNAYIMAECESTDRREIMNAIKEGRFYATQGPEIHLSRVGDVFRVDSSEVSEIVFMSNACYSHRTFCGEALASAEYKPRYPHEHYIRAYVTDKNGKRAWTNCIKI